MSISGELRVARFGLDGGRWQEEPAGTRAVHLAGLAADGGREAGLLLALVHAAEGSSIPSALYDHLFSAMSGAAQRAEGAPVRRVLAAARAGNALLFERNLRADGDHQVRAGLGCALVWREEVHVALLGPVAAVGAVGGHAFLQPEGSPWLGEREPREGELGADGAALPAGRAPEARPLLYRTPLAPDDLLALVPTDLVRAVPTWELLPALSGDVDAVRGALEPLGLRGALPIVRLGEGGGAALERPATGEVTGGLIQVFLREEAPAPPHQVAEPAPPPEPPPSEGQGATAVEGPPAAGAATPEAPELEQAAAAPATHVEPAAEQAAPGQMAEEPAPVATTSAAGDTPDTPRPVVAAPRWRPRVRLPRWRPRVPRPNLAPLGREVSERARRAIYRMEDVAVNILPDRVPERPTRPTRPSGGSIPLGGKALVLVAMVIPLVMLGVVIATRVQYERSRRGQFDDIQARAQAHYDAATTADNVAVMREGLYDALATTQEGLAIHPDDEMLVSLQRRIEHRLDQVNLVERIYTFYRLADLDEGTLGMSDASRIVVRGIDLYVLNKGSDRVYRFLMNDVGDALQPVDSDSSLIRKGELYDGVRVADLVDIAWMRAGGQRTIDTFVVLDRTGTMYAYDPQTGVDALPVADSDTWLKPEAIGGYFGNLYVLDPLLNTILKYIPVDNAYTQVPTPYLNPSLGIDLTGAVDMAVDGNMYVLFADGQVRKFFGGEEVPFPMNGLPSPMRSPSAIFVSGEQEPDAEGYVYVADTGNQRIVQFDKEGNYVRQLMAKLDGREMESLRGLYVDEPGERMLLVSGSALWYAKLPALGAR